MGKHPKTARLAGLMATEKARALMVILFCGAVVVLAIDIGSIVQANGKLSRQADRIAQLALDRTKENRRLFALEHPSDKLIRERIDEAIRNLTRRERERLLRALLSAVPPSTLAVLIQRGDLPVGAIPSRAGGPSSRSSPTGTTRRHAPAPSDGQRQPGANPSQPSPGTSPATPPPSRPSSPPPSQPPPVVPGLPPLAPLPHACVLKLCV